MFVTAELLDELNACQEDHDRFAELFPQGVELSRTVIVRHAQDFDWVWCADNLAGADGWAAYRQAIEPALDVYDRAVEPALDVYDRAEKQAWDVYQRAIAYATYQQAIAPARATLNIALANAFADVMGL